MEATQTPRRLAGARQFRTSRLPGLLSLVCEKWILNGENQCLLQATALDRAGVNSGIGIDTNSNSRNWNWIKGIGIGIDKEELKELIQFLFLIVNSFWFFAMFLAESLNQFDLKPFWIQLTRISLDRYIILYDNLSIKWILHCSYWLHL